MGGIVSGSDFSLTHVPAQNVYLGKFVLELLDFQLLIRICLKEKHTYISGEYLKRWKMSKEAMLNCLSTR